MSYKWKKPLFRLVSLYSGGEVKKYEFVSGGANNIGLRISTEEEFFFAKIYFKHFRFGHDRLFSEFEVMNFMWNNGIRSIPEPLAYDRKNYIAIYEFVKGRKFIRRDLSWNRVKQLGCFLLALHDLNNCSAFSLLPSASEACFCIGDYFEHQERRMRILKKAAQRSSNKLFVKFVAERLCTVKERLQEFVLMKIKDKCAMKFDLTTLTLNPGDHGLHNALIRGREIVFVDFEHAGRDDMAQVIANALLHPGISLPLTLQGEFISFIFAELGKRGEIIKERIKMVYPLVAFKWAMIMLNEFVPCDKKRRMFAGINPEKGAYKQLRKAEKQLNLVEKYIEGENNVSSCLFRR